MGMGWGAVPGCAKAFRSPEHWALWVGVRGGPGPPPAESPCSLRILSSGKKKWELRNLQVEMVEVRPALVTITILPNLCCHDNTTPVVLIPTGMDRACCDGGQQLAGAPCLGGWGCFNTAQHPQNVMGPRGTEDYLLNAGSGPSQLPGTTPGELEASPVLFSSTDGEWSPQQTPGLTLDVFV